MGNEPSEPVEQRSGDPITAVMEIHRQLRATVQTEMSSADVQSMKIYGIPQSIKKDSDDEDPGLRGSMNRPRFRNAVSLTGYVSDLCVIPDDMFVVCGGSNIRFIKTTDGSIIKTVSVGGENMCFGVTADKLNSCSYVTCEDKHVYKVTKDKTTKFVYLGFHPVNLTRLSSGNLLVCGGGEGLFSVEEGKVRKLELGVKFGYICSVAVNVDGDICVTDPGLNKVFVFDEDLGHLGTYSGDLDFLPHGVTCDIGQRNKISTDFIIADRGGHSLLIINRGGVCRKTYSTESDCARQPWAVDMSPSGQLYVGFDVDEVTGNTHILMYDVPI
ncbi:hypothetical protein ScPMuIL_002548 [Solemya velum]